jgi:hypothetical protein
MGRLKRSCFSAVVLVFASGAAVLVLGVFQNRESWRGFSAGDLAYDFLGIPLAPGWFITRGLLERVSPSSISQILGSILLLLCVSLVIDALVIFGVWELFCRRQDEVR